MYRWNNDLDRVYRHQREQEAARYRLLNGIRQMSTNPSHAARIAEQVRAALTILMQNGQRPVTATERHHQPPAKIIPEW